jgi:hypothetical protein
MEALYIGIDPSTISPTLTSGGGAIIFHNGHNFREIRLKQTEKDVMDTFLGYIDIIRDHHGEDVPIVCALEQVSAMPTDGRASLAKFMQGYGFLRGMLVASEVPFFSVKPHEWQKTFVGTRPKKMSRHDWKKKLKGKAQELLPQENVTLANADAYLLALYAKIHIGRDLRMIYGQY